MPEQEAVKLFSFDNSRTFSLAIYPQYWKYLISGEVTLFVAGIAKRFFARGPTTTKGSFAAGGNVLTIFTLDCDLPFNNIHGVESAGNTDRPGCCAELFIPLIMKCRPVIKIYLFMATITKRDFLGKPTTT